MTGPEKLRKMYNLFNNCADIFGACDIAALERIYDAYIASGEDITPDRWSPEQLEAALRPYKVALSHSR